VGVSPWSSLALQKDHGSRGAGCRLGQHMLGPLRSKCAAVLHLHLRQGLCTMRRLDEERRSPILFVLKGDSPFHPLKSGLGARFPLLRGSPLQGPSRATPREQPLLESSCLISLLLVPLVNTTEALLGARRTLSKHRRTPYSTSCCGVEVGVSPYSAFPPIPSQVGEAETSLVSEPYMASK